MASLHEFKLPDVGEGLTEAEILVWMVGPGDTVEVNQVLVEIETAKASVELPSPHAGVVVSLNAEPGQTVPVGTSIITIDTGAPEAAAEPAPALLVGYGAREESPARRRRGVPQGPDVLPLPNPQHDRPAAKPPVRKLAKDLGVELAAIAPTGADGVITRDDVRRAAANLAAPSRERRVPIRGVRKHTARAMVASAFTAPHVTEFVTVDITETMRLRDAVAARREFRDVKLSPLLFVIRALLLAARRTPEINARWDEAAQEIVFHDYVNLGIAAATDRGLVVPNIKDADSLPLRELAAALTELATTARAGKTAPADMAGGTITITNVGVFGVDTGTPILNPGEAAILAFGAVRRQPWIVPGPNGTEEIAPRWITRLALSFDHRLVDGQQGSQALADIAELLRDPALAVLW